MTIVCNQCGSADVLRMMWVKPNKDNEIHGDAGSLRTTSTNWCRDCNKPVVLTRAPEGGAKATPAAGLYACDQCGYRVPVADEHVLLSTGEGDDSCECGGEFASTGGAQ